MKPLVKSSIEKLRNVNAICGDFQYVPSTENGRGEASGLECCDCPYARKKSTLHGYDYECYWQEIFGEFPCNWKLDWLNEDGLKKWKGEK